MTTDTKPDTASEVEMRIAGSKKRISELQDEIERESQKIAGLRSWQQKQQEDLVESFESMTPAAREQFREEAPAAYDLALEVMYERGMEKLFDSAAPGDGQ